MTMVQTEWLLRVRDILQKLAYNPRDLGEEAECLGSYIPGFLDPAASQPSQPKAP